MKNITVALLTSRRLWVNLIRIVTLLIAGYLGITVDNATGELAVNTALIYGGIAAEAISFVALGWTKVTDEKAKP